MGELMLNAGYPILVEENDLIADDTYFFRQDNRNQYERGKGLRVFYDRALLYLFLRCDVLS